MNDPSYDPLEVMTDVIPHAGSVNTRLLPTGEAFVTRAFDLMGAEIWSASVLSREAAIGNHRAIVSRRQQGLPLPPDKN